MDLLDLPTASEEDLRKIYRKLALALEVSRIGIWEHDIAADSVVWDRRLCELYGCESSEGVIWINCVHPADRDRAAADFEVAIRGKCDYASQFRIIRPDGALLYLRSKARYYEDKAGSALMIGAEWDVTADVMLQEELARQTEALRESYRLVEHSALHDHLTGLANRRGLENFVGRRAEAGAGSEIAVLHIDLDGFKAVNDRMGHDAGDRLLKAFAERLLMLLPGSAFAARTGGDEFIVVLEAATPLGARLTAEAIVAAAASLPLAFDQAVRFDFGASVGVSIGYGDFKPLLYQADLALYEAKNAGRGRACLYGNAGRNAA